MGRGSARKKFALRRITQLGDGNQPKVRSYEPIIPELRCGDRKLWLTGKREANQQERALMPVNITFETQKGVARKAPPL